MYGSFVEAMRANRRWAKKQHRDGITEEVIDWFSPEQDAHLKTWYHNQYGQRQMQLLFGQFFITSGHMDARFPRVCSIRVFCNDGSIDTVGEFQGYASPHEAYEVLEKRYTEWRR